MCVHACICVWMGTQTCMFVEVRGYPGGWVRVYDGVGAPVYMCVAVKGQCQMFLRHCPLILETGPLTSLESHQVG